MDTTTPKTTRFHEFHNNCPLNPLQEKSLQDIEKLLVKKVSADEKSSHEVDMPTSSLLLPPEPIYTVQAFEDYYSQVKQLHPETYSEFTDLENFLERKLDAVTDLKATSDKALTNIDRLHQEHTSISTKTSTLRQECEQLVAEKARLTSLAEQLRDVLHHFTEFDSLNSRFHGFLGIHPSDPAFSKTLDQINSSILFLSAHRHFRDAGTYLLRFNNLQLRAFTSISTFISTQFKTTAGSISNLLKNSPHTGSTESNIFYLKFRALVPKVAQLIATLEQHTRHNHPQLLQDVHKTYIDSRKQLIIPYVNTSAQNCFSDTTDTLEISRKACGFLLESCCSETKLCKFFFKQPKETLHLLQQELFAGFSQAFYEFLRPICIRQHDINILCSLIHYFQNEWLQELSDETLKEVYPLERLRIRVLQDTQERLVYITQTFFRDEIWTHTPTSDELNYPSCLLEEEEQPKSDGTVYSSWYITLKKTLMTLSKIYLALGTSVFEGLAHEAVEACTFSLITARDQLDVLAKREKNKDAPLPSSSLNSTLFLIKHLLILREQIIPFDSNFSITSQTFDFGQLKTELRKIFSGHVSNLLRLDTFMPNVTAYQSDSRKDIEKELRCSIESYIMKITTIFAQPLFTFLTTISRANTILEKEAIKQALESFKTSLSNHFQAILMQLKTYIPEQKTQNILLVPVRDSIIEAFDHLELHIKQEDMEFINIKEYVDFIHFYFNQAIRLE